MKNICILCALPQEIQPFKQALKIEEESQLGTMSCWISLSRNKKIILIQSGVGKVHAAAATQHVITQYAPDVIFSCGTAGGLDSRKQIGDIVVGTTTSQHDYGFMLPEAFIHFGLYIQRKNKKRRFLKEFKSDEHLLSTVRRLKNQWDESFQLFTGPILTGDQVIFSSEKRQALVEQFDALAVDMESAAIAQVCEMHNIPFLAVRGISDHADESIHLDTSKIDPNEFAAFSSVSFSKKVSILSKTISYFAQHPATFRLSLQTRQNIKLAATNSAKFTLQLLELL